MKNHKQQNTGRRSFLKTTGLGMGALSLSPGILSMTAGDQLFFTQSYKTMAVWDQLFSTQSYP